MVENEGVWVYEPHEISVLLPNEFRSRVPIPADATLNLASYQPTTDDGNAALLANSAAALIHDFCGATSAGMYRYRGIDGPRTLFASGKSEIGCCSRGGGGGGAQKGLPF
jgi:hypothetical protein